MRKGERERERERVCVCVCLHCLVVHIIHMIHITVDVFLAKDSKMDLLSGTSKGYLFGGGQTRARNKVRKELLFDQIKQNIVRKKTVLKQIYKQTKR